MRWGWQWEGAGGGTSSPSDSSSSHFFLEMAAEGTARAPVEEATDSASEDSSSSAPAEVRFGVRTKGMDGERYTSLEEP